MAAKLGRPKGYPKSGGRQPGTANKRTKEVMAAVESTGMTPLQVMVAIMREAYDAKDHEKALDAASKAAPYIHAKLSSSSVDLNVKRDIEEYSDAELIALAVQAARWSPEGADAPEGTQQPGGLH
jgi:hypothetical protein